MSTSTEQPPPAPPNPRDPGVPGGVRERREVRRFYDEVGWRLTGDGGGFEDARRFDDLRAETAEYVHSCHRRVADQLESEGTFFLDAASGPVQFPEYLEYSRGFRYRVCVDLSIRALTQARGKLGGHGLYVLADVARLPFRDGTFRAGVSLSTIYHVPAEDQASAFCELARVAAPGGRIAVAYSWGKYSALMLLPDALPTKVRQLWRRWRQRGRRDGPNEAALYFHPHSPWWFRREVAPHLAAEMRVWRSVSVSFLRWYVPRGSAGRLLLRAVFALERRFPAFFGWFGQYPLIVLHGRKPLTGESAGG